MRRSDKEITDLKTIHAIVHACQICHLGLAENGEPYVVPISFGFDGKAVYFHTARNGRKIEMMTANPRACVQFEHKVELTTHDDDACSWSFAFESVIGFGSVVELESDVSKTRGLNQIMKHYSGRDWTFKEPAFAATRVWRVDFDILTGKRFEHKG